MKLSRLLPLLLSTLALSDFQTPNHPIATPADAFHGVATPHPIETSMVPTCDSFYLVKSGDTCSKIASAKGISLNQFYSWNKNVGSSCKNLLSGYYVCVGVLGARGTPESPPRQTPRAENERRGEATVSESWRSIRTTAGAKPSHAPTPSPIQPGMTSGCDRFHKVASGDTCSAIVSKAGISLSSFYKWNPKGIMFVLEFEKMREESRERCCNYDRCSERFSRVQEGKVGNGDEYPFKVLRMEGAGGQHCGGNVN